MKGFTLIELMGVIVILAVLAVIVVVGVDKMILNGKQDLYEKQITMIELSAEEWLTDYPEFRPTSEDVPLVIPLQTLVDAGYINGNIQNPKTGENFDLSIQIRITKVENTFDYEVID